MSKIFTQGGAPVSRHAFGTMQFGGKADEEQSAAMFHAARIVGINHFDTAHLYTGGSSEEMLGQLAARDREALIIATKVGYADGTPPEKLRADFDISRRRLGMEVVDILYLHRHDRQTPLEDQLAVLVALKEAGALRYIGLSNFAAWQVMKAERILREMGHGVDIIQPMYNLVKRQAEVELLPMCASEGIACAPYSPLGGGLLTGKYLGGGAGRLTEDERYGARYAPGYMHEAAQGLCDIADGMDIHPATLAVAWVARHWAGPMPILSARSAEQLAPSLDAVNYEMDDALYLMLAELVPSPPPANDRLEDR